MKKTRIIPVNDKEEYEVCDWCKEEITESYGLDIYLPYKRFIKHHDLCATCTQRILHIIKWDKAK